MLKKHAFLEFGVALRPDISSVSGFTESPKELVVSLWSHDFSEDMTRYNGRISNWKGPGEKKFRKQVMEANRERCPIRVVLATSQQPELVRAGRATEADNDFAPRFDLIGRLIGLDRDVVEFAFESSGLPPRGLRPTAPASSSVDRKPDSSTENAGSKATRARYWRVVEAIEALGEASVAQVVSWLEDRYPGDPLGDPRADLEHVTVNSASRPHYDTARSNWRSDSGHERDRLFKVHIQDALEARYVLFDPSVHGHVDLEKSKDGKWLVVSLSFGALAQAEREGFGQAPQPPIDSDHDSRVWTMRAIAQRQGQITFRADLVEAYEGRCAVTRSNAVAVLEAAHIRPYRGEHTNRVDNGILLRSDIHTLFDLGLLWISSENLVCTAPSLRGTEYERMSGQPLWLPRRADQRPDPRYLIEHARLSKERHGVG